MGIRRFIRHYGRSHVCVAAGLVLGAAVAAPAAAQPLATPAALTAPGAFAVTAFKQSVAEAVGSDPELAAFYRAREFAPLWTGAGDTHRARRAALLEALAAAPDHSLPAARARLHCPEPI